MAMSITNTTPSQYFTYFITVLLYAYDGTAFTGSCTVTVSCTGIAGTLTASNSAGVATFTTTYFTILGGYTITASVPASGSFPTKSTTLGVTVLIDKLVITFTPVISM